MPDIIVFRLCALSAISNNELIKWRFLYLFQLIEMVRLNSASSSLGLKLGEVGGEVYMCMCIAWTRRRAIKLYKHRSNNIIDKL